MAKRAMGFVPVPADLYEVPPEPERRGAVLGEDAHVQALANKLRAQRQAADIVRAEAAAAEWSPPWVAGSSLLSDKLQAARPTERWLVDRLMGANHNIVLAAQHGSGKTTLGLNLAHSLADGRPFLGREVTPFVGRVGWVNGEMDPWDWADYARPLKIKATDRIASVDLRDGRLPLLNDYVAESFAKWCVDHEIGVLVFDSWRRLCSWSGLDENVNADVERLTTRIDEFKKQAGVSATLILAHTGRAKAEEGEERVRGATALDDWVDGRWVMIKQPEKQGGTRLFWAEKRGVEMAETALIHNPVNNRITLGEGDRHAAAARNREFEVTLALKDAGKPISTSAIATVIGMGKNTGPLTKLLYGMEREGIVNRPQPQPQNGDRWALVKAE